MTILNNERLTTRVTSENKELLEQAAVLSGYSTLNSFIANAAIAEAKRLIKQETSISLCQEDAEHFINVLNQPVVMNHRFLDAANHYKETIDYENYAT